MRPAVRCMSAASNQATFEVARPFKAHKLTPPDATLTTTKEEMLGFLKIMNYYRRFETSCDNLYTQRLIRGFLHLYDGQEAIIVGMQHSLKNTDSVITAYRDHDYQLARGDSGENVFAELMGKATGCAKGKGGSMHMYMRKNNFFGGNGIVGAQVPVGAGLAFAHKYKKDGGVAVAAYGDGAANQGQIFEVANMAALWKLPVIFLCENNEYGMGTSVKRAASNTSFYTRLDAVPGLWFDGFDVLASKKAFAFAADWCRSGKGPICLEAQTYRYHGHSMSDPGVSYRRKEEIDNVRANYDCIELAKKRMISKGWLTEAEFKAMDKEHKAQVNEEIEKAKAAPEPELKELISDIFFQETPSYIRMPDHAKTIIDGKLIV